MASSGEAKDAVLTLLIKRCQDVEDASSILKLAEAWAWLNNPAQPHGGSNSPST